MATYYEKVSQTRRVEIFSQTASRDPFGMTFSGSSADKEAFLGASPSGPEIAEYCVTSAPCTVGDAARCGSGRRSKRRREDHVPRAARAVPEPSD